MTDYYLVIGVMLILFGACMVAWPRRVWYVTRGWRYENPKEVRLSAAHMTWSRISGAVGVVIGVVLVIRSFG